jgi:CPA2 family monovalent cation:H+ antiporter-2
MAGWVLIPKIVLLLAVAVIAGLFMRRLGQSVIVGYLLAGVLLGPSGLQLVQGDEDVQILSELGIALLLFSIGLEFSYTKLKQFGRVAAGAGGVQVVATMIIVVSVAILVHLPSQAGLVLGMAFAMSSTAVVVRALTDQAELDSTHGRNAVGILLFQDLAVIPVLIATDALGTPSAAGSGEGWIERFGLRIGMVVVFFVIAWLAARLLLPRLLSAAALSGSRDLPVVVAVCTSIGAAWGAHSLGFSPSLGAFLGGLVLSESPFATQIRADVTPLSAVFVTLFFSSVGTVVDLPSDPKILVWMVAAAAAVMVMKSVVTATAVWVWQRTWQTAVISGILISQVGEFTFVIVESGHRSGLVSGPVFQFALGVTLLTLIATPFAIRMAPRLAVLARRRIPVQMREAMGEIPHPQWKRVIVIGFGPAGQQVVARLVEREIPFLVMEMNPNTVAANRSDIAIELGDATQREVLQHVGVGQSLAVIVTIPDPGQADLIISGVQRLAPNVLIVARSRYHQHYQRLERAGADCVVDEEMLVGGRLAEAAMEVIDTAKEQPRLPV